MASVLKSLHCSCCTAPPLLSPDIHDPSDRVEIAFRRLDQDGDGFLGPEDFAEIGWPLVGADLEPGQLSRIFRWCDQTGDGRVSLREFREMADSKGDLSMEGMFD